MRKGCFILLGAMLVLLPIGAYIGIEVVKFLSNNKLTPVILIGVIFIFITWLYSRQN